GVLYGSFIKTSDGIKVIEFNARFGDPESINLLTLLKSDLHDLLYAVASKTLSNINKLEFDKRTSVFKYLVPHGYPDNPVKGEYVTFDRNNFEKNSLIYGNMLKCDLSGSYVELGSRTLGI